MKRLLRSLLLAAVLTAALCVGALAAEPTVAGIYAVTDGNGVTLTPQTAGQSVIAVETQESYGAYYANAVRFGVEKDNLTGGAQYLLLVVKGTEAPSEKNIVYIDQQAADSNGKVSFNAYPSSLTKDNYRVYVVGQGSSYSLENPTARFSYYQPYTLGDVNGDGEIDSLDALDILQHAVGKTPLTGTKLLAADVNGDKEIDSLDALAILQYAVGRISSFN